MRLYLPVILASVFILSGCGTSELIYRSYDIGVEKTVGVGDTMIGVSASTRTAQGLETPPREIESLVYNGVTGGVVSLIHRHQPLDGPPSTVPLKYDLGTSSIIGLHDGKINILEATNDHIRFSVLQDIVDASWLADNGLSDVQGSLGFRLHNQFVTDVQPGSPSAGAGIQKGDFVLSVNGSDLSGTDYHDLGLLSGPVGSSATIVLNHNGEVRTINLTRTVPNGKP